MTPPTHRTPSLAPTQTLALALALAPTLALSLLLLPGATAHAEQTVGLFERLPGSFPGYTLFAPNGYTETYLIDDMGWLVQSWPSAYTPGNSAYLLDSGHLLRTANPGGNPVFNGGGAGGLIDELDWDGTLLWEFLYSDSQHRQHHDIAALPGGNVLVIAWEYRSGAEAIAAGRDPGFLADGELWPDHIVEVEPVGATGGNIVWEWHAWDHLIQDFDPTRANFGVVEDHPELVDLNFGASPRADWLHVNAIDYNEALDQIVVSVPRFSEFWVIDHSTTTPEAASHSGGNSGMGGDILYRWGNPQAYRAGTAADRKFYAQHDVNWIDPGLPGEGNVLVFNNGNGRPEGAYSSVEEIVPPVDQSGHYPLPPAGAAHGPAGAAWIYTADPPTDFFASFLSGARRQPNGTTLICDGPHGSFFEVTPAGERVWLYVNPVTDSGPLAQGEPIPPSGPNAFANLTFRALRYGADYPGLDGRDLTPSGTIEQYPAAVADHVAGLDRRFALRQNVPNPFHPSTEIAFSLEAAAVATLRIYDVLGRRVATLVDAPLAAGDHRYRWRAGELAAGVYRYTLRVGPATESRSMILVR